MKSFRKPFLILILSIISASALMICARADNSIAYGAATVSAAVLNMRAGPDTSYPIVMTLTENDILVVLEQTNDEWYYINFHGDKGYVNVPYLKDILTRENFNAIGSVTGERVYVRRGPSTSDAILTSYPAGTEMTVIGINTGWYKVKHEGYVGYMRSDNMEIIQGYRAASSDASSKPQNNNQSPSPSTESMTQGEKIAAFALSFVGSRYVNGGTSPSGFDCSGLTFYVYKNFGYSLTRNASGQFRDNGTRVNKSDLIPGDLIFTSSNGGKSVTHVGIYIGDDEFVHASTSSTGVIISRLDSTYYINAWYGAKRIV